MTQTKDTVEAAAVDLLVAAKEAEFFLFALSNGILREVGIIWTEQNLPRPVRLLQAAIAKAEGR